jgi:DNA mismatch repair ATPase MutS
VKPHLFHPAADLSLDAGPSWNADALAQDLALDTILDAMAAGDPFVRDVSRHVLLAPLDTDADAIGHRQAVLRDCLAQPAVVRELYRLAVQAHEEERKQWGLGGLDRHPDWVLYRSLELMGLFTGFLGRLWEIGQAHAGAFVSDGWRTVFATWRRELDESYLAEVRAHVEELRFRRGTLLSARLDRGNRGTDYVLHRAPPRGHAPWDLLPGWLARHVHAGPREAYRFSIHPRDESGARALRELRERGTAGVARALATSADHVRSFFSLLRTELAFYVGSLNLHERLRGAGEPTCFPVVAPPETRSLAFGGLYDPTLALRTAAPVVGNDGDATARDLVVVTGPNQGGKSTLLRAIGHAQLMMQRGMFVAAESFTASPHDALFTHYKREEDVAMESGKLDEELRRMSDIVDHVTPSSMILFNESFAATNEREGSEIAGQIVSALLEKHIRMVFVTHQYEFARGLHERRGREVLFLRAERDEQGSRTFKLREGAPLTTSYGEDLYRAVFGD